MSAHHVPFTVVAELSTPPIVDRSLLLDGMLLGALGERMGAQRVDGWAAAEDVYALPLPLARVESPHGWWWAASAAQPYGPEQQSHLNRVPLIEEYERWTTARSVTHGSGPDKRLRVPFYYRAGMFRLTWTGVGARSEVESLLALVPAVGRMRGHGHGWVRRWTVTEGGPPLEAYGRDVGLRHLPAETRLPSCVGGVTRRQIPLRPPYHRRADGVPCWQQFDEEDAARDDLGAEEAEGVPCCQQVDEGAR